MEFLSPVIVLGLDMTTKVSDCWYDHGYKSQGKKMSFRVVFNVSLYICDFQLLLFCEPVNMRKLSLCSLCNNMLQ